MLPICLPVGIAFAQTEPVTGTGIEPVRWLLEAAGIETHMATVRGSIAMEARHVRQQCPTPVPLPAEFDDQLLRGFAPATLMEAIQRAVHAALTPAGINTVRQWMMSPAGVKVRKAEAAVSELDEARFDAASATLIASDAWTHERRALISALVRATRTAAFLVAVNTEISAAVHLAGACAGDDEMLNAVDAIIAAERSDESFYAVFMTFELIVPTGVVFAPLSDVELRSYLDFTRSAAGKRYHEVLIESTRRALRASVANLREYLAEH